MKRFLMVCILAAAPVTASAAPLEAFTDFIVFGDSYSDGGNAAVLTSGTPEPQPNPLFYPDAQFTNGDVWATQLGATASLLGGTNYAVGGAEAVNEDPDDIPFDLGVQIGGFLADFAGPSALTPLGSRALAVIFIGGNDLREANPATAPGIITSSVAAIRDGVSTLLGAGISDVVVLGLPNLGRFPEVVSDPVRSAVSRDASVAFNGTLRTALATLPGSDQVTYFDTFGLFESIFDDPAGFGLDPAKTTVGCIPAEPDPTDCTGDLGYLFVDNLHASEPVHTALASALSRSIAPVPLPATGALLFIGLGSLVLAARRRTR